MQISFVKVGVFTTFGLKLNQHQNIKESTRDKGLRIKLRSSKICPCESQQINIDQKDENDVTDVTKVYWHEENMCKKQQRVTR